MFLPRPKRSAGRLPSIPARPPGARRWWSPNRRFRRAPGGRSHRGCCGACFARDCTALVRTAREAEAPLSIVETVVGVNEARKARMADKIIGACGGSVAGKSLAVLGLTFKPNTDDMRDAPSLAILP